MDCGLGSTYSSSVSLAHIPMPGASPPVPPTSPGICIFRIIPYIYVPFSLFPAFPVTHTPTHRADNVRCRGKVDFPHCFEDMRSLMMVAVGVGVAPMLQVLRAIFKTIERQERQEGQRGGWPRVDQCRMGQWTGLVDEREKGEREKGDTVNTVGTVGTVKQAEAGQGQSMTSSASTDTLESGSSQEAVGDPSSGPKHSSSSFCNGVSLDADVSQKPGQQGQQGQQGQGPCSPPRVPQSPGRGKPSRSPNVGPGSRPLLEPDGTRRIRSDSYVARGASSSSNLQLEKIVLLYGVVSCAVCAVCSVLGAGCQVLRVVCILYTAC
jgi:hypothetical protein